MGTSNRSINPPSNILNFVSELVLGWMGRISKVAELARKRSTMCAIDKCQKWSYSIPYLDIDSSAILAPNLDLKRNALQF